MDISNGGFYIKQIHNFYGIEFNESIYRNLLIYDLK